MGERLFSPAELVECRRKASPDRSLAGKLAAKEAIMKALNLRSLPARSRRIEILAEGRGAPNVYIDGEPIAIEIAITHDAGLAVAIARYRCDEGNGPGPGYASPE